MSFIVTRPATLLATAGNLQEIGAGPIGRNAAAASPTTASRPAAAKEISVFIEAANVLAAG